MSEAVLTPPSWSAHQLAEFLAAVSAPQDRPQAVRLAVERAAESLDAEVAALVSDQHVAASVGFPANRVPEAQLLAAACEHEGLRALPGLGTCSVATATVDQATRLLVARQAPDGFATEERQLLRAMARVLALTLDSLRRLEQEREVRRRLAVSERQTRQILETAYDAFVAVDSAGLITDWNPQAQVTFGWSAQEALGREVAETIIPQRYRAAHRRGLAHFLASGEGPVLGRRLELVALHREGRELPVELTISATDAEEGLVFNAFLRDVSERKRHERYLEAQHTVAAVLAEADRVDDAVPRLLEAIGGTMGWDFAAYWAFAANRLSCEVIWTAPGAELGAFEEASRRISFEPGAGLPGRTLRSGHLELIEDIQVDPDLPRAAAAREVGLTAAVAIPLCVGGEVRGVVEFIARGVRHPEPELVEVMESLSGLIGRFISIVAEREELRGRLERLAETDELTRLSNRRGWGRALKRELAHAERSGAELCVALIDLDHFKAYNDEHGHLAGDDLLRDTTAAWSSCLRATDVLARVGGDEFALAFPASSQIEALAVIQRLRSVTAYPVTCSAGLVARRPGETAQQLTARADIALYAAKGAGGDAAHMADDAVDCDALITRS